MKKVKVDETKCIGCGSCVAVDPDHFDFNDNGMSFAKSQENVLEEDKVNTSIQEAIDCCPVGAIEVFDGCENPKCTCNPCNCGDDCQCDGGSCCCK